MPEGKSHLTLGSAFTQSAFGVDGSRGGIMVREKAIHNQGGENELLQPSYPLFPVLTLEIY